MKITFDEKRHEYSLFNGKVLPAATDIMKSLKIIDDAYFTKEGTERGKRIHEITAEIDKDFLSLVEPDYPEEFEGYIDAWKAFKKDYGVIIKKIEEPVGNSSMNYAGTPDRIALIDNHLTIIEIKSGAKEKWHGLQLASYAIAYDEMNGSGNVNCLAVYLKDNGKYLPEHYDMKYYKRIWLSVITTYQFKHK